MSNLILSPEQVKEELGEQKKHMRLYYHKTDGGAEYLFDTFIECQKCPFVGFEYYTDKDAERARERLNK